MPLTVTTLPVKKCSGNDRSHFQNTNINIKISAQNGQSASGGHSKSSPSRIFIFLHRMAHSGKGEMTA